MSKLKSIINNRVCAIIAHGSSVNELETRMREFKDFDLCWCGMNYFLPTEKFILNKVGKQFDMVFDCSQVEDYRNYELIWRVPNLREYLSRDYNNCFVTLAQNLGALWNNLGIGEFQTTFTHKIVFAETLGFNPKWFCVSLPLFLTCLIVEGAKAIVIFGMDAHINGIEGYYKPELMRLDKRMAGHENVTINVMGDANNVNCTFFKMMGELFNNKLKMPTIINVSPESAVTIFKKMNYSEVLEWLKETNLLL